MRDGANIPNRQMARRPETKLPHAFLNIILHLTLSEAAMAFVWQRGAHP
jgi:hypothetical protein